MMKRTISNFPLSMSQVVIMFLMACLSIEADGQWFKRRSHQNVFVINDEDEDFVEDTIKGLTFGLNIGGYFGNAETAGLYNGSGSYSGYINEAANVRWFSVDERIGTTSAFVNDIREINTYYNSSGYGFPYDSYPTNMKYNPAMYVGLQLKYNFNRYDAIIFNINALKLKAAGQFTMQFYGTPQQINAQSDVRLFPIIGEEQRFNITTGYRHGWMMGDLSNFYLQAGGSMLGTKWTNNYVIVAERSYDLVTSMPVIGQAQVGAQPTAQIGFGGYFSTGFEFWFGKYSFDLSFGFSRDQVKLMSVQQNVWNKWLQASFTL